ncbi:hypothetical protein EBB07_28260 [Paenibacillaceae bacterium]|nr:hypothetical protein EBB07_28260 [Paenibacillaceae bacterium]
MSRYFKVKRNTEAWDKINHLWTFGDKWIANKIEIESFLGFPMQKNLYLDIETLTIDRSVLPREWENQFKKNTYPATAKKNSKINIQWRELANKLKLEVVRSSELSISLGIFGQVSTYYPQINEEYYFKLKDDTSRAWDKINDWAEVEWAEEIKEYDFLRIQATWIEQREFEQTS